MPHNRCTEALRQCLMAPVILRTGGPWTCPPWSIAEVNEMTVHSLKRARPAWDALAYPCNPGEAAAESGAWAGSRVTSMTQAEARSRASGQHTALRYGSDGVDGSASSVAIVSTSLVAAWVQSYVSAGHLPPHTGWSRSIAAFRDATFRTAIQRFPPLTLDTESVRSQEAANDDEENDYVGAPCYD